MQQDAVSSQHGPLHSLTGAPSVGARSQKVGDSDGGAVQLGRSRSASLKVSISPVTSPPVMAPPISQLRTLPSPAHHGPALFLLILQTLRSSGSLSGTLIQTSGDLSTQAECPSPHGSPLSHACSRVLSLGNSASTGSGHTYLLKS